MGWHLLPIYSFGPGKIPPKRWSAPDRYWPAERLAYRLLSDPTLGISLRLDQFVALDSDNEAAEELAQSLSLPKTVTWRTRRGFQRLFLRPASLDHLKAIQHAGPLEVRSGRGAHSVIPPSPNREWLHDPWSTPVAMLGGQL